MAKAILSIVLSGIMGMLQEFTGCISLVVKYKQAS